MAMIYLTPHPAGFQPATFSPREKAHLYHPLSLWGEGRGEGSSGERLPGMVFQRSA